jgi:peptidoglycan/xylan/chitin deacetylase (PgdA/CDA1 family)
MLCLTCEFCTSKIRVSSYTNLSLKRLLLLCVFCISLVASAQAELSVAIKNYDTARVFALIAEGADVTTTNENGATPLMEAVITNQFEVSLALLEAGADVNARLPSVTAGSSVTNFAAQYADAPLLGLLLERGAETEGSLLAMAYINRQTRNATEITQLLLDAGAPIDETIRFHDLFNDRSLLDYFPCIKSVMNAPYNGGNAHCEGMAGLIIEMLDSPNVRNLKNPNSLAFAAMFAGPDMMAALLRMGLNPNEIIERSPETKAYPAKRTTPLELALYKRNRGVVPLLLQYGARLDIVDPGVLQIAALDPGLEPLLRQAGVDTRQLVNDYNASHQQCSTPIRERAYVSFIFDDGERTDLDIIKRIFLPRNVPGTIAAVSGFVGQRQYMNIEELEMLEQAGWEIASHTQNHLDLSTLTPQAAREELNESYFELRDMGFEISVLVYPFGGYDERVAEQATEYYEAAFAGGYELNRSSKNVYALTRYNITNKNSLEEYLAVLDRVVAEESWLVWTIHTGYDLGWEQQQNLDRLLGVLCERGVVVTTASGGLLRLK